jgi:hypothetical protein
MEVFYSRRGLSQFDVQRLSVKLKLACGERSFDELHLIVRISLSTSVRDVRGVPSPVSSAGAEDYGQLCANSPLEDYGSFVPTVTTACKLSGH